MLKTAIEVALQKGFKKTGDNTIEMTLSIFKKDDTSCVIIKDGDTIRVDLNTIGSYEDHTLFFRSTMSIIKMSELTDEEKRIIILNEYNQYKSLNKLFV